MAKKSALLNGDEFNLTNELNKDYKEPANTESPKRKGRPPKEDSSKKSMLVLTTPTKFDLKMAALKEECDMSDIAEMAIRQYLDEHGHNYYSQQ